MLVDSIRRARSKRSKKLCQAGRNAVTAVDLSQRTSFSLYYRLTFASSRCRRLIVVNAISTSDVSERNDSRTAIRFRSFLSTINSLPTHHIKQTRLLLLESVVTLLDPSLLDESVLVSEFRQTLEKIRKLTDEAFCIFSSREGSFFIYEYNEGNFSSVNANRKRRK